MIVVRTRIRGLAKDHGSLNLSFRGRVRCPAGFQDRSAHRPAAENPRDVDIGEAEKAFYERPRDISGQVPTGAVKARIVSPQSNQGPRGNRVAVRIAKRKCEVGISSAIMALALRDVSAPLSREVAHAQGEARVRKTHGRPDRDDGMHQAIGGLAVSSLDSRGKHGEPSPLPG
jgi:hypothetical protein